MASQTTVTTLTFRENVTPKPRPKAILFDNLPAAIQARIYGLIDFPYTETHVHAIRGFPEHIVKDKDTTTDEPAKQGTGPSPPSQLQWPNADYVWPPHTPIGYFTWNLKGGHFLSTTAPKIHPLLHVCRESRDYIIKKYKLVHAFGTLINLDRDIVFLDASTAIHFAEVNNPGIEAFAELLRHLQLIKKIKCLAFHVEVHDYLWLTKCAEKMKGLLTSLEELYLVWTDDGRHDAVQKTVSKLKGNNLFFIDVTQEGFETKVPVVKNGRSETTKKEMEQRWTTATPDHKVPKNKRKTPKFKHVFAKEAVFGIDHGVVSYREFVAAQPPKLPKQLYFRPPRTEYDFRMIAMWNAAAANGYRY